MMHTQQGTVEGTSLGNYRIATPPPEEWIEKKRALDGHFQAIGWGLFLALLGVLWLAPSGILPASTWLVGAGTILLGLNAARFFNGIDTSGFTIVVGVLALGSGVYGLFGLDMPLFPAFLLVVGVGTLVKHLLRRGTASRCA